jgi:hypothetical protein
MAYEFATSGTLVGIGKLVFGRHALRILLRACHITFG